jgi:hypothetical protein
MTDNVEGFTKEHRAQVSGVVFDRETQQKMETCGTVGYGNRHIMEGTVKLISWDHITVKNKNETPSGSPNLQLWFYPANDEKAAANDGITIWFTNPPIGLPTVTSVHGEHALDVGNMIDIPFTSEGGEPYHITVARGADTSYKEWIVKLQQFLPMD